MPRPSTAPIPPAEIRKIAVVASCDPRTVRAYLDGRRVLESIARGISAALRKIGRAELVRAEARAA